FLELEFEGAIGPERTGKRQLVGEVTIGQDLQGVADRGLAPREDKFTPPACGLKHWGQDGAYRAPQCIRVLDGPSHPNLKAVNRLAGLLIRYSACDQRRERLTAPA